MQDYKIKNRKGILGLDTSTKFILALLILGVIGFISVLALNNLSDIDIGGNIETVTIGTFKNNSVNITSLGAVPANITGLPLTLSLSLTNIVVTANNTINNLTSTVDLANFTINSTGGFTNASANPYFDRLVNITGLLSYTIPGDARELNANVTRGIDELFTNSTTWFSLIAIVIIILIIAVVIIAVKGFGGEKL